MITDRLTAATGSVHGILPGPSDIATSAYLYPATTTAAAIPSRPSTMAPPPTGGNQLAPLIYAHPPQAMASAVSAPSPSGSDTMNAATALSVLQDAVYVAEKGGSSIHRVVMTSAGTTAGMKPAEEDDSRKRSMEMREAEDDLGDGGGTTEEDEAPPTASPELPHDTDCGLTNGLREGRWTTQEHELFLEGYRQFGKSWRDIATIVPTRTPEQIRTHAQKYFGKTRSLSECSTSSSNSLNDPSSITNMAKRVKVERSQQSQVPYAGPNPSLLPPPLPLPQEQPPEGRPGPDLTQQQQPASPSTVMGISQSEQLQRVGVDGGLGLLLLPKQGSCRGGGDGALSILIQELENNDTGEGDSEVDTDEDGGGGGAAAARGRYAQQPRRLGAGSLPSSSSSSGALGNGRFPAIVDLPGQGGVHADGTSDSEGEESAGEMKGDELEEEEDGGRAPSAFVPLNRVPVTVSKGQHQQSEKVVSREGRWSKEEHQLFLEGHRRYGKVWKEIAALVKTRTAEQVRTHAQKWQQREAKRLTHAVRAVDNENPSSRRGNKSGKQGGEQPSRQPAQDVAPLRSKRQRQAASPWGRAYGGLEQLQQQEEVEAPDGVTSR